MALTLDGVDGVFANVGAFYKAIVEAEQISNITDNDRAKIITNIREAAQTYLINRVRADTPLVQTLEEALREVVQQALDQSETCDAPVVTLGSVGITNMTTDSLRGSTFVVLASDRFNRSMFNMRPNTMRIECVTAPEIGRNYTAGFQLTSTPLLPVTQATWFSGLGYSNRFSMGTAQNDGQGLRPFETLLSNGGFERFTGDTPDNWTASTWAAGTHFNAVTTPYIGTNALRLIGDGATNGKLRQVLNDPSGSPAVLRPRTTYLLTPMVRRYATGAITGVVRFSLENAAGSELYSSGKALDVSSATTTYDNSASSAFFYTGDTVSATNYVVIESTTALGNTHELFIDEFILCPCLVIPGFGRLAWLEGSAAAQVGDYTTVTSTNDGTGLQLVAWERLFDWSRYDLCIPCDGGGGETITDSISVTTPN